MATLPISGTDLYYDDAGDGVPVVFSHGLLWSARMFSAQMAALQKEYRCVAWDHRGQGRSGTSPTPYTMDDLTDDAIALMTKLSATPCHFVGLSMGGMVGLRIALRRPELLRSLTLVDSAADAEPWLNIPKYRAMSLVSHLLGYRPLLPAVMKIMFGHSFLKDQSRLADRREQERQLLSLEPARTDLALHAVTSRQPVESQLGQIKIPVQVVHGAEDKAIVPPRARRTCDAIAGARWVEIPRAGHTSTVENPSAVTLALSEFFHSVDVQSLSK